MDTWLTPKLISRAFYQGYFDSRSTSFTDLYEINRPRYEGRLIV